MPDKETKPRDVGLADTYEVAGAGRLTDTQAHTHARTLGLWTRLGITDKVSIELNSPV